MKITSSSRTSDIFLCFIFPTGSLGLAIVLAPALSSRVKNSLNDYKIPSIRTK